MLDKLALRRKRVVILQGCYNDTVIVELYSV